MASAREFRRIGHFLVGSVFLSHMFIFRVRLRSLSQVIHRQNSFQVYHFNLSIYIGQLFI